MVDPSEYQPQVVILEDRLSVQEEVPTSQREKQASPAPEVGADLLAPGVGANLATSTSAKRKEGLTTVCIALHAVSNST